MLLAIDVGNTNTVFALFNKGEILDSWRIRTEASRSQDEYAVFFSQVCALFKVGFEDITDVIISSVVPETRFSMTRFCTRYLGCEPLYVNKEMVDIEIDLLRPEDVGADRLVNALAVKVEYRTPAIVIDFGTATTFDVIDARGAYAGGVIVPGVNLSLNALHSAASKLPKVSVERMDKVIGKTTVQAMKSGLYWGYSSMIEGMLAKLIEEIGEKPLILATGGLSTLFADNIDLIDKVDEQLTLKGLYEIYTKNKEDAV